MEGGISSFSAQDHVFRNASCADLAADLIWQQETNSTILNMK